MSTAEDIKNKIWAMANELRGNMDASEYRDYILGFMFYRFLSEHQLNWQSENEFPAGSPIARRGMLVPAFTT